ncbi:Mitotic-spindle organizing protein 1 [Geodia barretti]|uniref:Mitotic-spindle organizing protein 1 n=1 Tax=Geodia barretti TaxID=519541 RepID=A0AA35X2B3_GEOBA|nr:Mitotic-spindle organizing protein 1 [Geodia barretti]
MAASKEGAGPSTHRIAEARDAMKTVKEISDLLNTGLDEETLKVCVQLLEAGVNPEALAAVVRELRRETAALREAEEASR